MAQLTLPTRRSRSPRTRPALVTGSFTAAVVMSTMIMSLVTACGDNDTREVGPSPTTTTPMVPSSIPWDQSRDGLIETLTKMGLDRDQASCVVDRMDSLDRRSSSPSDQDRTQIEQLIEDCLTPG